jgi:hypothetical protein
VIEGRKIKNLWLSGGAPAACIVQAEDDSLWIMEARAPDLRPRGEDELSDLLLASLAVEYRWRRLPPIPTAEQEEAQAQERRETFARAVAPR